MKIIYKIILLMFVLLTINNSQSIYNCAQGTTVKVAREYSSNDATPEEGKKHALDLARSEAIKQVVGVKISEETFRNLSERIEGNKSDEYFDSFSQLSRSTAFGKIVNEKVQYTTRIDEYGTPIYTATLYACVVEEKGISDPSFSVAVSVEKPVFLDRGDINTNDALQFNIKASQSCYIYLFNLLANDSVQLLFPNEFVKTAYYDPKIKEQEFEKIFRELNAKFIVQLPYGKIRSKEALYIVALKDNIPFPILRNKGFSESISTAMNDIMLWLVHIPSNQRTEAFQSYELRRK